MLLERGLEVEVLEFARGEDPASDILEVATQREAELVVIGLRRRSPVGKFMLGSNSQAILLSAECPVLAVKAPHSGAEVQGSMLHRQRRAFLDPLSPGGPVAASERYGSGLVEGG